jgi:hypothetical protein
MEVSGHFYAPATSPHGKSSRYPLDKRLGGLQSQSGRGVKEKNSQPPPGFETRLSDRPDRSQSLYRLSYPGSYPHLFKNRFNTVLLLAPNSPMSNSYNFLFTRCDTIR